MATGDTAKNTPTIASAAQQIYDNLVGVLHLSKGAAAGVLGNLQTESGFNPNAYNANENAHGFAQWEGGRWSGANGLQAFASQHNLSATSTQAEIGYLDYELTHGYSGVLSSLRGITGSSSSDATNAAQIFQSRFEGSTPDSLGARESNARSILTQLNTGNPLSGGPVGTSSVSALGAAASFDQTGGDLSAPPLGDLSPYSGKTLSASMIATIKKWLLEAAALPGNPYNSPTAAQINATNPQQLGIFYQKLYAEYQLKHAPITGPLANLPNWFGPLESWVGGLITNLGRWTADAFLIIIGVIMVILALYIVAKSSGTDVSIAGEGEGGPVDTAAQKTTDTAEAAGGAG